MEEDIDWTLLGKYLFGECTEREETRVHAWIERDPKRRVVLGQLRKILRTTEDPPSAEDLDAQALWERVDRKTRQGAKRGTSQTERSSPSRSRSGRRPPRGKSVLRKLVWPGAIAAVVTVTITLWLFGPLESGLRESSTSDPEIFLTQKGQRTSVRLSDGSQVRLNVDSRLTVPPSFGKKRRVVYLEGEAFFEVQEDSTRPFVVRSKGAATRVLGTAFDVSAYPEDEGSKIVVAEGRVVFQSDSDRTGAERRKKTSEEKGLVLMRHQMARILQNGEQIVYRKQDVNQHLAWIDGELVLRDASFEKVARSLERWYNLEISMEQGRATSLHGHLNARFARDQDVDEVLKVVATAFRLEHNRDEKQVVFSRLEQLP